MCALHVCGEFGGVLCVCALHACGEFGEVLCVHFMLANYVSVMLIAIKNHVHIIQDSNFFN